MILSDEQPSTRAIEFHSSRGVLIKHYGINCISAQKSRVSSRLAHFVRSDHSNKDEPISILRMSIVSILTRNPAFISTPIPPRKDRGASLYSVPHKQHLIFNILKIIFLKFQLLNLFCPNFL